MSIFSGAAISSALMSISAFFGAKSTHTEIVIPSTPDKIWQVLIDLENYKDWNPAMTHVSGKLGIDHKVIYHFKETEEKSANISSKAQIIEPNKKLVQKGGLWGLITFEQSYSLKEEEQGTHVTLHEDYTGLFVHFWDSSHTQKQYEAILKALKDRTIALDSQ